MYSMHICTILAYLNISYVVIYRLGESAFSLSVSCLFCRCAMVALKDIFDFFFLYKKKTCKTFSPCCLNLTHFTFYCKLISLKPSAMQYNVLTHLSSLFQIVGADTCGFRKGKSRQDFP